MLSGLDLSKQIYCFDIFDTIISRKVDPEYVKKIWCREIGQILELNRSAQEIYSYRNEIEAKLCTNNQQNGHDLEFQYEKLVLELKEQLDMQMDSKDLLHLCLMTELNIEKRVQFLCSDVVDTIKELKQKGKKVICILNSTSMSVQRKRMCPSRRLLVSIVRTRN